MCANLRQEKAEYTHLEDDGDTVVEHDFILVSLFTLEKIFYDYAKVHERSCRSDQSN